MFYKEVALFALGFSLSSLFTLYFLIDSDRNTEPEAKLVDNHVLKEMKKSSPVDSHLEGAYDESLQKKLYDEVNVLCWVMTHSDNHKTRDPHLKNTWGKRCKKLLFFSDSFDPDLPTIDLNIPKGRENLWLKTKAAFIYVYKHHFKEFDWFLRVDDDNYIVMENLRYLLYQYNPNDSLYFGHKFGVRNSMEHGYMAGGGLVLSKEAVRRFNEEILPNSENCRSAGNGIDDWILGECLKDHAIFVDNRDEHLGKRFFPVGVEEHMKKNPGQDYWYYAYMYYKSPQGNLDCCSDTYVGSHYVSPQESYFLDYAIYHVHPFGIEKPNKLPPKLNFEDVKRAGEIPPYQQAEWRRQDEVIKAAEEAMKIEEAKKVAEAAAQAKEAAEMAEKAKKEAENFEQSEKTEQERKVAEEIERARKTFKESA